MEDIISTTTTPAGLHLFDINDECPKLDKARSERFHHVVTKLLYLSKSARPDIETAVAFLCTRVPKSDEDDWKELRRLSMYFNGTMNIPRIIGATSLTDLYSWVDASYTVHWDMKSHTDGVMSFSHGALHTKSSKQKSNTKSSTEAKLAGISSYSPYNIWMRMFLKQQGYDLEDNIMFQDNQSTIILQTTKVLQKYTK